MKIEFFELSDDGQHIIAVMDGKRMIISTSKKVSEILSLAPTKEGESVTHPSVETMAPMATDDAPLPASSDALPPDENTKLQKQDLVKVVGYISGLKDASGNELNPRTGVVPGGIYRVQVIHQTMVTIPDPETGESKMETIINSIEAIDDASPRPELVTLLPGEFLLYKKRGKAPEKTSKLSVIYNCPSCGEPTGLIQEGGVFKGKCMKCSSIVEKAA
jgi:hypothetical protein